MGCPDWFQLTLLPTCFFLGSPFPTSEHLLFSSHTSLSPSQKCPVVSWLQAFTDAMSSAQKTLPSVRVEVPSKPALRTPPSLIPQAARPPLGPACFRLWPLVTRWAFWGESVVDVESGDEYGGGCGDLLGEKTGQTKPGSFIWGQGTLQQQAGLFLPTHLLSSQALVECKVGGGRGLSLEPSILQALNVLSSCGHKLVLRAASAVVCAMLVACQPVLPWGTERLGALGPICPLLVLGSFPASAGPSLRIRTHWAAASAGFSLAPAALLGRQVTDLLRRLLLLAGLERVFRAVCFGRKVNGK